MVRFPKMSGHAPSYLVALFVKTIRVRRDLGGLTASDRTVANYFKSEYCKKF